MPTKRRTSDRTPSRTSGILGGPVDPGARLAASLRAVSADPGRRVLHRASGFTGEIIRLDGDRLVVRGHTGLERTLRNAPGDFSVDGQPVRLVAPSDRTLPPVHDADASRLAGGRVAAGRRTASGSRAVEGARAQVAKASRVLVEGVHDAELVERVWGDDLRIEGVVVERLDGIDHLDDVLRAIAPARNRRIGVLVDHLVAGSKEARIANAVRGPHVLVTGTPFVDVWQAVRPRAIGIDAWPVVPKGTPWKDGVCAALGVDDPAAMWRRILASVRDWRDLEQPLVNAVERLVDFVTEPQP
jgi:hypothetical protein